MSKLIAFGYMVVVLVHNVASIDYGEALTKSLLYFEAQRSGKLPPNQRAQWRANSALDDGKDVGIDLTGGYYDAGDNVKFGFPMAFTVTMLSWSVVEFGPNLRDQHELRHALEAIKWGTDYLIKAHPEPNVLYGQVGEADSDHRCWQRPEDMTTPRTVYKIDEQHPGADLAGETAAAFAAASLAFKRVNPTYSSMLLNHAKQLYDFAMNHPGLYQNSIPDVGQFYSSHGYEDELLWASAWMARATDDNTYVVNQTLNSGGTSKMFSWDDKHTGAQVLIAKGILEGKFPGSGNLAQFRNDAEQFICNCIQKGTGNAKKTIGGLLYFDEWDNLQYVTSASFIITAYADILSSTKNTIQCSGGSVEPEELIDFARSQVDYILGENPKKMSYMVGFGENYPQEPHHRAASIPSIKSSPTPVGCQEGFGEWFDKQASNPNVLEGAIVGGPDGSDEYTDSRANYQHAEAATANVAPIVGVLARLA